MDTEITGDKNKKAIQNLPLKIFASILPALLFMQDLAWLTVNKTGLVWFLVFWGIIIIYVAKLEKYQSLFKIFRLAEVATFFAPVAVLILFLVVSGDKFYGAIAGLMGMVITAVIALFFGIIFHFIANSFKKKSSDITTIENTKKCPYCAEMIKKEAEVCHFCGKEQTQEQPIKENAVKETEEEKSQNQQLIDYINQNRQQGIADDQIKQALLDAGWAENDIDSNFTESHQLEARRKKLNVWHIIAGVFILLAFIFLFLIIGSVSRQSSQLQQQNYQLGPTTNTSNTSQPSTTATTQTWHTVTTFDATSDISTPPFSMRGSQWRVIYTCAPFGYNSENYSAFTSSISPIDKDYNVTGNIGADACPHSDTFYVYNQSAGQYYLEVKPTNAKVTETIEDYY